MLQLQTIEPGTLTLLKRLQQLPELNNFHLAGGTALALKYGHRISVDLDLFGGSENFNKEVIVSVLEKEFGQSFFYEERPISSGVFCFIEDVKVDIVKYEHPVIASADVIDEVRMFSTEDIIDMKLNAILGRGTKKDFFDIYELLDHYSIEQMISFHRQKFPKQMLLISIPQALTYFIDAEETENPVSLKGQTWEEVKNKIQQAVGEFLM